MIGMSAAHCQMANGITIQTLSHGKHNNNNIFVTIPTTTTTVAGTRVGPHHGVVELVNFFVLNLNFLSSFFFFLFGEVYQATHVRVTSEKSTC